MDDNPHVRSLLEKLYDEGLSPAEREDLDAILRTADGERLLHAFMDAKAQEAFDESTPIVTPYSREILRRLESSIKRRDRMRSGKAGEKSAFPPMLKIAASFVGILLLTFIGIFAYQNHQTVTYMTDSGTRQTIILPDLSTVTLQGNSSLTYKRDWQDVALRKVELRGEAYFSVTKDKEKPFIVNAGDIEIRVLGTTFTVKSYEEDESAEASLLEGSIAIRNRADADSNEIMLRPNQKATFLRSSQEITLSQVAPETYASPKSTKLIFEDERFGAIVKNLERKYGVRIEVEDEASKSCRFSATIHHESLKEVLDLFASTANLSYRISGKSIKVSGRLCPTNP